VKSFVPIAMVSDVSYVMIAARQAPFDTVPQLLAYGRLCVRARIERFRW